MSALAEVTTIVPPDAVIRRRVTWRDHVWLTWRRQRGALVAVLIAVLALVLLLIHAEHIMGSTAPCRWRGRCDSPFVNHAFLYGDLLLRVVSFLPLVIGLFWGVPVVAREIEQRTTTLAWSQDVSPRRWLLWRLGILTAITVAVSAVVSFFAARLAVVMHEPPPRMADGEPMVWAASGFESEFGTRLFELLAPMTVVYSVAGLLVGVAVGALVRQVLPAIALVTVTLVSLRVAVAAVWRPRFQQPEVMLHDPFAENVGPTVSRSQDALVIDGFAGWADSAGNAIPGRPPCYGLGRKQWNACMEEGGYLERMIYQPPERLDVFQWIETGIFVAVGVAAVVLTLALLRGRRVWV